MGPIPKALVCLMTLGVALVTLIFGFAIGDVRSKRRLVNAQIDASVRVKKSMDAPLAMLNRLRPILANMDPKRVDWKKVEAIPDEMPGVDAALVLSPRPPVAPELSTMLGRATADVNELFLLVAAHKMQTLKTDRSELEGLEKGEDFQQNKYFAVLFQPLPPETKPIDATRPPRATIVAVAGTPHPNEAKDDNLLPIKSRQGKEREVSLTRILMIDKGQLFSGGANALTLYTKRVDRIKVVLKRVMQYETALKDKLSAEAARTKVFSI